MKNKKQILKRISSSISKHYGSETDFQIVWALNKTLDGSAKFIEVMIIPGTMLNDIIRMEKIDVLNGKSDYITEKNLYEAIRNYTKQFDSVSIEEFIPF